MTLQTWWLFAGASGRNMCSGGPSITFHVIDTPSGLKLMYPLWLAECFP
jgi:hypothetical protein